MRAALVDKSNVVQNVILADPEYRHAGPETLIALNDNDAVNIGDKFNPRSKNFTRADAPQEAWVLQEEAKHVAMGVARTEVTIKVGNVAVRANAKPKTLALLSAMAFWGERHQDETDVWLDAHGNETELTGAQFVELYTAVVERVRQNQKVLCGVLNDIKTKKSRTYTHVNAAPWPLG